MSHPLDAKEAEVLSVSWCYRYTNHPDIGSSTSSGAWEAALAKRQRLLSPPGNDSVSDGISTFVAATQCCGSANRRGRQWKH